MTQYAFSRLPDVGEALDPDDLEAITALTKAAVIGVFEGDYSSYSLSWSVVTSEPGIYQNSHFTAGEDLILVIGYGNLLIIDVTDGSITTVTNEASSGRIYYQDQARSSFNKYAAFVDSNNWTVNIYKDGVKLDEIEVDDSGTGDLFDGIAMSGSGRFILVCHRDRSETPDVYTLRLYEGS